MNPAPKNFSSLLFSSLLFSSLLKASHHYIRARLNIMQ
ncbi:Opacity protein opA54, partial [Neisseria gonorrhoeae]